MPFKNFSIWRGRLPHWRADEVTYYVTFRHRRPLDEPERLVLLRELSKPDQRKWTLFIVCVLPEKTDLIFKVLQSPDGSAYELSQIVEKAKTRAGKLIVKKTGERFPPFYQESFDRIIRNEGELEELWTTIASSPREYDLANDPEEYSGLWISA